MLGSAYNYKLYFTAVACSLYCCCLLLLRGAGTKQVTDIGTFKDIGDDGMFEYVSQQQMAFLWLTVWIANIWVFGNVICKTSLSVYRCSARLGVI